MLGFSGFCDFTCRSSVSHLAAMTGTLDDINNKRIINRKVFQGDKAFLGLNYTYPSKYIKTTATGSEQPSVEIEDRNAVIFYSGRISNLSEIKENLSFGGDELNQQIEAKILLKAFSKWGTKLIEMLIGEFSLFIFSKAENKLYIVKDKIGAKPLYYYWKEGIFLFSTQLRDITQHPRFNKELDPISVADYFKYNAIFAPYSAFKDTYKLEPGNLIVVDLESRLIIKKKYGSINDYYRQPKLHIPAQEARAQLHDLLISAMQSYSSPETQVGVLLSGGLNSALIAAMLQNNISSKLKTITITPEYANFNTKHTREIATYLGSEYIEYHCMEKDAVDIVSKLPHIYDEPLGDISIVPTIMANYVAKQQHLDTIFLGGANSILKGVSDVSEYFGPYNIYYHMLSLPSRLQAKLLISLKLLSGGVGKIKKAASIRRKIMRARRKIGARTVSELVSAEYSNKLISDALLDRLLVSQRLSSRNVPKILTDTTHKLTNKLDELDEVIYLTRYLPTDINRNFVLLDGASAFASLEAIQPYTDHRVVDFVSQLPADIKAIDHDEDSLIKVMSEQYYPEDILTASVEPHGSFSFPIANWLYGGLREMFEFHLSEQQLQRSGVFNVAFVQDLKKDSLLGSNMRRHAAILWKIFMFQVWYETWVSH